MVVMLMIVRWKIRKMLFSMPKIKKQIRRLQEKGYPVKGILEIVQSDNETNTIVYTYKLFQPCTDTFSEKYHFIGPMIRPIYPPKKKKYSGICFCYQMAVLSIADVFITHCGMNSASEGLYFKVPLVLFPQTPEQGAVAARTAELGAGVLLQSISREQILAAVNEVINNDTYRQNAVRISKSFQESGGAEEAAQFLEKIGSTSCLLYCT